MEPNNQVDYSLKSNTSADNYTITKVPGTLRVTSTKLSVPYGAKWLASTPGTATWTPISKKDLTAGYVLTLYAYDGVNYTQIGGPVTTTDNSYDFAQLIRDYAADAENGKAYSYSYTIQTIPSAGAAKDSYQSSDISDKIGSIYTAEISVSGDSTVSSASINGASSYILLSGETASVTAVPADGHSFGTTPYTASEGLTVSGTSSDAGFSGTVSAALTTSVTGKTIVFTATDQPPVIESFTFTQSADLREVTLSAELSDTIALDAYCIKLGIEEPSSGSWTSISGSVTTSQVHSTIAASGDYYLFVRDSAGNVVRSEDPVTVYELSFAKGADAATGTMSPILKVKNSSIALPKNAFEYEGYLFQNWHSANGIYGDQGTFSEDLLDGKYSATLTAYWTQQQSELTVNYYFMDTAGEYSQTPETTILNLAYGAERTSDMASLQISRVGFELDTSKPNSAQAGIGDSTLNIYYKRLQYDLTLSYTNPDGTTNQTTQQVYYGTPLSTILSNKPSAAGYNFIGWLFGDSGSQPETMPAHAVTAIGYFEPAQISYQIVYYKQDLNADGTAAANTYTVDTALTTTVNCKTGDPVEVSLDTAQEIEGYTYKAAVFADAQAADGSPCPEAASATLNTTATANKYLCLYYDRTVYNLTLNVYKGAVDASNKIYTYNWEVAYGAVFPDSPESYDQDNWQNNWPGSDKDEYLLAEYVGWSSGSKPSVMPAGDVAITRQYVSKEMGLYKVVVYTETATEGEYTAHTFSFYDNIGKIITVGEADDATIKISDFSSGIDYFQYYEFAEDNTQNVLTGSVTNTNDGDDPLELKVYLDRQVISSTITYYADNVKVATVVKSVKWGHTYNYEPLALFDTALGGTWAASSEITTGLSMIGTVSGSNPDVYDFRHNSYVISFIGSGILNYDRYWHTKDFNTVASLSGSYSYEMGYSGNYVNIYYTKADPETMYRVKVQYNSGNLSHGENKDVPLTYTYNSTTYSTVWLANEAYFYTDSKFVPDGEYATYPGLAAYTGGDAKGYFTHGTTLKEGYTAVTINGSTYFTKGSEFYIPDSANRFYKGHFTSYGFTINGGADQPGSTDVLNFLSTYKSTYSSDPYAQGAYIYNRSFGSTIKYDTSDTALTITFLNGNVYQIYYNLNGAVCKDSSHRYAAGSSVTAVGCTHDIIKSRTGYDVVWYRDDTFTTPASCPFTINSDITLYGRYEKKIILNTLYAYYELPDYVTVNGKEYKYITENDLDAFGDAVTTNSATALVTIQNEFGENVTVDAVTTTYTYKGNVVMVSRQIPSITFTTVTADTSALPQYSALKYDSASSANVLSGYCQSDPLKFTAYFIRDEYSLTVDSNVPNGNTAVSQHRAGETVAISNPERNGYEFAGWTWTKETVDQAAGTTSWTEWETPSVSPQESGVSLVMPEFNVKATAVWTPVENSQAIMHYFQNTDFTYSTDLADQMMKSEDTAVSCTIIFNGATYENAKKYSSGNQFSFSADGENYYFNGCSSSENNSYTVSSENLIAICQQLSLKQDETTQVSSYIHTVANYSFSNAVYQLEENIQTLSSSGSFANSYGMTVEYYYQLNSFTITTLSKTIGGGSGTAALIGAGTYPYGREVTLNASTPEGYTFVGWFNSSDVTESFDIKTDASKALRTDPSYTIRVTANASYTAVIRAITVDEPELTLSGVRSLTYGYEQSAANSITVTPVFPSTADPACYVKSYKWFINGVEVSGATAASLPFPAGKDAGDYQVTCEVTVARKDSGCEIQVVSAPYTVKVSKNEITASAVSHTAVYDGTDAHSITVNVDAPAQPSDDYVIYYSLQEINESNYSGLVASGDASTENLTFKDVNIDAGGNTIPYTVYYYVRPTDIANNIGCTGSSTVTITPKKLTLSPGTASYSKVYDGTAEVLDTDLTNLTHSENVYVINGIIASESVNAYIISCEAAFNSRHVSDAAAVTLSNIALADKDTGTIIHNYSFDDSYSIDLTGYIQALPITLTWDTDEFAFDGQSHIPTASLPSDIPSVDKANLSVSASGAQVNTGTYNAAAALSSSSADTQVGDYSLANGTKQFTISTKAITLKMKDAEVTYDGQEHTLTEWEPVTLADGHTLTASASDRYSQANTVGYSIAASSVSIVDADGADMTANYQIALVPGTLKILPQMVTVSGIEAQDKAYDGTATAALDLSKIAFTGIVEGDELSLNAAEVSASFADKNAGENKNVDITYSSDALSGASAANYTLDTANSQQASSADITKLTLTVTADNTSVIYGEQAEFTSTYSGFLAGEDEKSAGITGSDSVSYTVGDTSSSDTTKLSVKDGGYTIHPDVTGLSATNYTFEPANGTLTVVPREIAVAATTTKISKLYDGTTAVLTTPAAGTHYVYTSVEGNDHSGIANGDDLSKALTFTSAYADKNVGKPDVNLTSLSLNNPNYTLKTESFAIPGEITQKSLEIRAENKTTTYGSAAPEYTVKYYIDGKEVAKPEADLTGELKFACAYNIEDTENRSVKEGGYVITPSGLSSTNYALTYTSAVLTVNKAELTVTAVATPSSIAYGTDPIPAFTNTITGFKYNDTDAAVSGMVTYSHSLTEQEVTSDSGTKKVVTSVPGTYTVSPVIDDLTAANYTFKPATCTVTVTKLSLTINGITFNPKVYDGTANVLSDQINYSGVNYQGLLDIDKAVLEKDGAQLKDSFTISNPMYDSKDVGTGKAVSFTLSFGNYLASRYEAKNNQTSATADIALRPVVVQADNIRVGYGHAISSDAYTVSFQKVEGKDNSGIVQGETPETITTKTAIGDDQHAYTTSTECATYTDAVKPVEIDTSDCSILKNYVLTYKDGDLEVYKHQLDAPVSTWDDNNPGTITWTAVDGIGDVAVAGYSLQLQKVENSERTNIGSPVSVASSATATLEHDFAELIRENGAGEYKVAITSIASEVNNAGKINVQDSVAGTDKDDSLFAAKVFFAYASDATTQAGKGVDAENKDIISINHEDSYVVIAGEKDIPIAATLKNATGYTIKSVTSVETVSVEKADDSGRTGADYASTFGLSASHASSEYVVITLALSARPATATLSIAPIAEGRDTATYGYSSDAAPSFTATAAPDSSKDNITAGEYTYTYKWELQEGRVSSVVGTDSTWLMSTGKAAGVGYYKIRCTVTATRNDNGMSITYPAKASWDETLAYVAPVTINKAAFTAESYIADWTYGQTPNSPSLPAEKLTPAGIDASEHPGLGKVSYEYRVSGASDDSWTSTKPTDAGSYQVRAIIPESNNYNAFTTDSYTFTIAKAKLATPANLTMSASATASYGKITWSAVEGPKANGTGTQVTVTYTLRIYKDNSTTVYKEYSGLTSCEKDITADLQVKGSYKVEVIAVSGDQKNCENSDPAAIQSIIIGAAITVTHNGATQPTVSGYSQVYDGIPAVLTANVEGTAAEASYQWYKNGALLSGCTSQTLSVIDVSDSAAGYTCDVTVGDKVYSPVLPVTITKRPITITADNSTKIYDGTELTYKGFTITTGTGVGLDDGTTVTYDKENGKAASGLHTIAVSMTTDSTITNAGTQANTISTVVIKRGEKDVTEEDYVITKTAGELKISRRPITVVPDALSKIYGQQDPTFTYTVTYTGDSTKEALVTVDGTEDTLSGALSRTPAAGTQSTENVTTDSNKYYITLGTLGNSNYDITFTDNVEFVINRKNIAVDNTVGGTVTVVGPVDVVYDGTEQKEVLQSATHSGGIDCIKTNLVKDTDYTLAWYSDSEKSGTDITNIGEKTIVISGIGNYYGEQTVTYQITKPSITITSNTQDWTYDGQNHKSDSYTVSLSGTEVVADESGKVFTLSTGDIVTITSTAAGVKYFNESYSKNNTFTYTVTKADGSTDSKDNYFITENPGTLSITKRDLTIVSATNSWIYDGSAHTDKEYTYTYSGSAEASISADTEFKATLPSGDTLTITANDENGKGSSGVIKVADGTQNNSFTYSLENSGSYNVSTTPGTLTINTRDISKAENNVTVDPLSDVLYNGEEQKQEAVVKFGDTVLVKDTDYTVSYTTDCTNAGTVTITVTGIGNYSGTKQVSYQILPRTVVMTSATDSKTYDGKALTNDTVTVTGDGFVKDEGANYTVTGSRTDAGTSDNTFTYALNEETLAGNYSISQVYGKLTVNKITTEIIIAANNKSKVYDGTALTDNGYTYTEGVLAEGDTLTAVVEGTITNVGTTDNVVTSYQVKRGNVDATANYTFGTSVDGTLEVTKRPVSITAANADKKYGEADPAFDDATMSGNVAGELGAINLSVSRSNNDEAVGTYEDVLKIADTKETLDAAYTNYEFTVTPADFEIKTTDAALVITSSTKSWTYDSQNHTDEVYTVTLAGSEIAADADSNGKTFTLYNGDKLTITATAEGVKDYDSSYKENNTYTYTLDNASNYTNVAANYGTLSINKKAVSITAADAEKKYGEADPTFADATMSGNVAGELGTIDLSVSRSNNSVEAVGTYNDVLNIKDTKETLDTAYTNYVFTITPADFEITTTDAAVVINSASNSWTYDGQTHTDETYTVTLAGNEITADADSNGKTFTLYNGDKLTITATAGVKDYDSGYSKNNTYTYNLDHASSYTSVAANYGTLSIEKKAVTITAADADKKYGAADPAFTDATMSGNVAGELGSIDLSVIRTNNAEAVGTYTDVLSIADSKATLDSTYTNYVFTVTPADFEITTTDAAVTVASSTKSWTYDSQNHTDEVYTVTLAGSEIAADADSNGKTFTLYNGDKLTITAEAEGVTDYNAGYNENNTYSYVIDNESNYTNVTAKYGTLSINKKAVTITADNADKKYGEADPAFTDATMSGNVAGELGAIDLSVTRSNDRVEAVGTYKDVLKTADTKETLDTTYTNYVFTVTPADFEIKTTDAAIVITSASNSWKYDGQTHTDETYTVTLAGSEVAADADSNGKIFTLYNSDKLTITAEAEGVTDYNAGYNENNTYSYVISNSANYTNVTPEYGTLSITKRDVTITSATDSKAYDGTALTNDAVTVSGDKFVDGEGASYSVTGTITDKGSVNNTFSYELNSNTKADNYNVTKTEGTLTITAISTPRLTTELLLLMIL